MPNRLTCENRIARMLGWPRAEVMDDDLLTEIRASMNESTRRIYKLRPWEWSLSSGTVALSAASGSYYPFASMDQDRGMTHVRDLSMTPNVELTIGTYTDWLHLSVDTNQRTPEFAALGPPNTAGTAGFHVYPTPNTALSVEVHYWRTPTDMTASGMNLDLASRYESAFYHMAAILAGQVLLPPQERSLLDRFERTLALELDTLHRDAVRRPGVLRSATPFQFPVRRLSIQKSWR